MSELECLYFSFHFLRQFFFAEINTPTFISVHSQAAQHLLLHLLSLQFFYDRPYQCLYPEKGGCAKLFSEYCDPKSLFGFGILKCSGLILPHRMEFYAEKTMLLGSTFSHPVTITFFLSQKVLFYCSVRWQYFITSAEREVKDSRRSGMYQSCNFLTRLGKQSLQVFGSILLFDEVRAELVRDISRSFRFL